jgi:RimJ/RimL family protein N-acetyltransferase
VGDRDEAAVSDLPLDDVVVRTPRLLLRGWRDEDAEPFARINADPAVMRFLGSPMSRADSDALLARFRDQMEHAPYGRWAVEHRATGELVGFLGLGNHPVAPEGPEIGWRFGPTWWRQGLATEAATAVRDLAFDRLGLERIVSVTVPDNVASLGVMRRIGLTPFAVRQLSTPEDPHLPVVVWSLARADRHPAP